MKKRPLITLIGNPVRKDAIPRSRIDQTHRSWVVTRDADRQSGARVTMIAGRDGVVTAENIDDAEKVIARSRMILLSQDTPLGVIIHASDLAKKHQVRVLLDPAPMMNLSEKIKRALALIPRRASSAQKRHAPAKKWRRRKLRTVK
ncbi:MAG: hypothetical protein ACE3JK_15915 [Sporolactobacillus sp.]